MIHARTLLIVGFLTASCSGSGSTQGTPHKPTNVARSIGGKWYAVDGSGLFEFLSGGYVTAVEERGTQAAGTYQFLEAGRLRMDFGSQGSMIYQVSLIGDTLVLVEPNGTEKKFTRTGTAPVTGKERAYIDAMKSDLRNFVTAEEAYFADSVKYSATVCSTAPCRGVLFAATTGNRLRVTLTADGWTASITNNNTSKTCSIFIGRTPLAPATKEGEPKCQ